MSKKLKKYSFRENNSGGEWWLNKQQYQKLFANGWKLEKGWDKKGKHQDPTKPFSDGDDRDDAPYGWRHSLYFMATSMQEAVECWENATGEDFFSRGCHCCGAPFSMREKDGEYLSGNSVLVTVRPW